MWLRYDSKNTVGSLFELDREFADFYWDGNGVKCTDGSFRPQDAIEITLTEMRLVMVTRIRIGDVASQIRTEIPNTVLYNIEEYHNNVGMSLLTQSAFNALVSVGKRSGIVSIGAGSGFTEYLLASEGVKVVAYDTMDMKSPSSSFRIWWATSNWFDIVKSGNHAAATVHSNRTLLLSWPESDSNMGVKTLKYYRGDTLVYIGEGRGGRCANDAFFDYIDVHYTVVMEIPIKSHYDMKDFMWVLKKVKVGIPTKKIPKKYSLIADWIIEQQFVGAVACGEPMALDPKNALIQTHNGGFISWMTMAGASFEDAVATVRDYKKPGATYMGDAPPADVTELLPKDEERFNIAMIRLLRRLNGREATA